MRAAAHLLPLAFALLLGNETAGAKSLHPDYRLLRAEVQQYGDWLVGCDNAGNCTMLGFPKEQIVQKGPEGEVIDMGLQISLNGVETQTEPIVELAPISRTVELQTTGVKPRPFVLSVEFETAHLSQPHGFARQQLVPAEAAAVMKHLRAGKQLAGTDLAKGRAIVRFPQLRTREALRVMQSRRAALLEQLADKAIDDLPGDPSDGSAMPVPTRHRRKAATELMVSGFSPIFANNRCQRSILTNVRHYRFSGGEELWSYRCDDGSATRSYWQMAPNAASVAIPLVLAETRGGKVQAGVEGLDNATFDWDFGMLRSYEYQAGREDCGTFRAWAYTNDGWQLIERREMPLCEGLTPENWIRTYSQPTTGAGPDE